MRKRPEDPTLLMGYGEYLWHEGDLSGAREHLLRAVKANPLLSEGHFLLSMVHRDMANLPESIRSMERAVAVRSTAPDWHFHLGNLYYLYRSDARTLHGWDGQRCIREAMRCYDRAWVMSPTNYTFAAGYAETFYALEPPDWAGARKAWLKVLEIAPDAGVVYGHLSRIALAGGRLEEARALARRVHEPLRSKLESRIAAARIGVAKPGAPLPEPVAAERTP